MMEISTSERESNNGNLCFPANLLSMLLKMQEWERALVFFVSWVSIYSYCCHESRMRFFEVIFILFFMLVFS